MWPTSCRSVEALPEDGLEAETGRESGIYMERHTRDLCWLLAWAAAITRAEQHEDDARSLRAERRFTRVQGRHAVSCTWPECPVRRAGGAYHWVGLV
jgi:hypothetical protein